MTKVELIKTASAAYPDRLVERWIDDDGNLVDPPDYCYDALAGFVARELLETYEAKKEDETEELATHRQLAEATRVIQVAMQELGDVNDALDQALGDVEAVMDEVPDLKEYEDAETENRNAAVSAATSGIRAGTETCRSAGQPENGEDVACDDDGGSPRPQS